MKNTAPRFIIGKPYHESTLKYNIELIADAIFKEKFKDSVSDHAAKNVLLSNMRIYDNELWIKQNHNGQMPFFKLLREDIICVRSNNVFIEICTIQKNTPFVLLMKITDFENAIRQLPSWSHFARIHRSWIVNRNFIEKKTKTQIWLRQGCGEKNIPVTRPETL
jgi:DNA-binding LytR/AlgR family response regulator